MLSTLSTLGLSVTSFTTLAVFMQSVYTCLNPVEDTELIAVGPEMDIRTGPCGQRRRLSADLEYL